MYIRFTFYVTYTSRQDFAIYRIIIHHSKISIYLRTFSKVINVFCKMCFCTYKIFVPHIFHLQKHLAPLGSNKPRNSVYLSIGSIIIDIMAKREEKEKREKRFELRLTQAEYDELLALEQTLQMDKSDIIRRRTFNNADAILITGRDFRLATDKIGAELGKIGSNVNQFARYANSLYNSNKVDPHVLGQFRNALQQYKIEQEKLISVYSALLKSKKL